MLDPQKTTKIDINLYEASINHESFTSICGFVIFLCLGMYLVCISLKNGYYVIYDTIHAIKNAIYEENKQTMNPGVVQVQKQWTTRSTPTPTA